MLVLSRKPGEEIRIEGDISIKVLGVSGSRVRIGIEAPREKVILRGELDCWKSESVERNTIDAFDLELDFQDANVANPVSV